MMSHNGQNDFTYFMNIISSTVYKIIFPNFTSLVHVGEVPK